MPTPRGAPSLYEASKRQAIRIIKNVDDLGEMPFSVAEPLLKKVQTAAHLHRIELNCPQFIGETRDIWITLIKRDLPQWDGSEPKNPASWYKLYQKELAAETRATEEDALILKATMDKLAAEKGDRQILTTNLLHKSKVRGSRTARPGLPADQSSLRFNNGSRTKMVTGKDVVARARREARERSQALNSHSVLARPTHTLSQRATAVRHAPVGLVQQHQQANLVRPPRNIIRPTVDQTSPRKMTHEEREARLKAVKEKQHSQTASKPATVAGAAKTSPNVLKRKLDDVDDLFGDSSDDQPEAMSGSPPSKRPHNSPPAPAPSGSKKPATDIFLRKPVRRPVR